MRTEWEAAHILSLKDVKFGKRFFALGEIRYWHLTSPIAANVPALLPLCNGLDRILSKIPGVQLMSWIFTFEFWKSKNAN